MSRNKLSARILRQSARALSKLHASRSYQRAECAQIRAAVFARRRRARLHAVVVRRLGFSLTPPKSFGESFWQPNKLKSFIENSNREHGKWIERPPTLSQLGSSLVRIL